MGSRNAPHFNLKEMLNPYQTKMSIYHVDTEETAWCPFILDLSCVVACRPFINADLKYENTKIYTINGTEFVIIDDYKDFFKILNPDPECSQVKMLYLKFKKFLRSGSSNTI